MKCVAILNELMCHRAIDPHIDLELVGEYFAIETFISHTNCVTHISDKR